jgi:hypothetical protein
MIFQIDIILLTLKQALIHFIKVVENHSIFSYLKFVYIFFEKFCLIKNIFRIYAVSFFWFTIGAWLQARQRHWQHRQ